MAGQVVAGSTLLSIETTGSIDDVAGLPYPSVLDILKRGDRPVKLTFRIPEAAATAEQPLPPVAATSSPAPLVPAPPELMAAPSIPAQAQQLVQQTLPITEPAGVPAG